MGLTRKSGEATVQDEWVAFRFPLWFRTSTHSPDSHTVSRGPAEVGVQEFDSLGNV